MYSLKVWFWDFRYLRHWASTSERRKLEHGVWGSWRDNAHYQKETI